MAVIVQPANPLPASLAAMATGVTEMFAGARQHEIESQNLAIERAKARAATLASQAQSKLYGAQAETANFDLEQRRNALEMMEGYGGAYDPSDPTYQAMSHRLGVMHPNGAQVVAANTGMFNAGNAADQEGRLAANDAQTRTMLTLARQAQEGGDSIGAMVYGGLGGKSMPAAAHPLYGQSTKDPVTPSVTQSDLAVWGPVVAQMANIAVGQSGVKFPEAHLAGVIGEAKKLYEGGAAPSMQAALQMVLTPESLKYSDGGFWGRESLTYTPTQPAQPQGGIRALPPEAITPEALQQTATKYGMTVDQVKQVLGIQ